MKQILFIVFLYLLLFPVNTKADNNENISIDTSMNLETNPEISLFESVQVVKEYIEKKDLKFDDMYLHSVSLTFIDTYPKKGHCWHYAWNYKKLRMGGEISIFHYMDGTIHVHNHGP